MDTCDMKGMERESKGALTAPLVIASLSIPIGSGEKTFAYTLLMVKRSGAKAWTPFLERVDEV